MNAVVLFFFWLVGVLPTADGFSIRSSTLRTCRSRVSSSCLPVHPTRSTKLTLLTATKEDDDDASSVTKRKRKRVRKDKDEGESVVSSSSSQQQQQLKPRDDTVVKLQVQDVRDVVSGNKQKESTTTSSGSSAPVKESSTSPTTMSTPSPQSFATTTSSTTSSSDNDDALKQLLADAREMQQSSLSSTTDSDEEDGLSIPKTIRNVISTIITVDFFFVCAFLIWFLAGVFQSYVLKDDTIQIAFNNNFSTLVQPALGILMIGSIAGSFAKEEDE